jgi:hypothetical protein
VSELNSKVVALIERELKKDRGLHSSELQAKAVKIDKAIAQLSGRQFHARYALQVRRRLFGGAHSGRTGSKSRRRGKDRNPVRDLLAQSYETKRAQLDVAVAAAFDRAMKADSIAQMNKLLSALDRHTRELKGA